MISRTSKRLTHTAKASRSQYRIGSLPDLASGCRIRKYDHRKHSTTSSRSPAHVSRLSSDAHHAATWTNTRARSPAGESLALPKDRNHGPQRRGINFGRYQQANRRRSTITPPRLCSADSLRGSPPTQSSLASWPIVSATDKKTTRPLPPAGRTRLHSTRSFFCRSTNSHHTSAFDDCRF